MTDELQLLARAHRAYLRAPAGQPRASFERIIDALTSMIAEGRSFMDDEPDPAGRSGGLSQSPQD